MVLLVSSFTMVSYRKVSVSKAEFWCTWIFYSFQGGFALLPYKLQSHQIFFLPSKGNFLMPDKYQHCVFRMWHGQVYNSQVFSKRKLKGFLQKAEVAPEVLRTNQWNHCNSSESDVSLVASPHSSFQSGPSSVRVQILFAHPTLALIFMFAAGCNQLLDFWKWGKK